MKKPSKWESRQERDLREAQAYIDWECNPCGKPKLWLRSLVKFPERQDRLPCLGVDAKDERDARDAQNRGAMLTNLQGAYHYRREFPGKLAGYYEGPRPDGTGWMIEIYGEGDAWPLKPEPPKPEFMR
jgi:hypothetical protein